jgi:signal transduction histidine kinase
LVVALFGYLPRGNALSDTEFKVRHQFLQWVLVLHLPALLIFGLVRGYSLNECVEAIAVPAALLALTRTLQTRRLAALALTAGLSTCSVVLVVLSGGSIEAHFHFFVTIGLIALYQDWAPFVWNFGFTVLSHGIGSRFLPDDLFSHLAGQHRPWTWAIIHGLAVLAASIGTMMLLAFTERDHRRTVELRAELAEGNHKRFTADLLVNLARRNQNLIYRQLELLNRLEDHERDADQLSHLFQLDHLATRIRRNAESLLVLSGEEPARKWGGSVLLVDVVRAAIAEIEELDRVDFSVDEALQVSGRAVADATHLLAELIENAVHFSPPGLSVMVRTRPYLPTPGAHVLTIEDWGVGMPAGDLSDANDLLRRPREVNLASAQRLGLHVVARLAGRYGIRASLESTPGGGVTAVVMLPAELFTVAEEASRTPVGAGVGGRRPFAALNGPGPNGAGPNGAGPNGAGPNGAGPNGAGPNGAGPNGTSSNGPSANGVSPNGVSPNGTGSNGAGSNGVSPNGTGSNGTGSSGASINGAGSNGASFNGAGSNRAGWNGAGPNGAGLNGAGPNGAGLNGAGLNGAGSNGAALSGPSEVGGRVTADREIMVGDGLDDLDELGSGVGYFGRGGLPDVLPPPRLDKPGPAGLPRPGRTAPEPTWETWWPLPTGAGNAPAAPGRDSGKPGPGRGDAQPGPGDGGLARRTPQANLADELRRGDEDTPAAPVRPRRDPTETRSALSRFQATQRAAREGQDRKDRP